MESGDEMDVGEMKQPVLTQYHYYWKQYSTALGLYNQMFHNLNSYYIRNHRQSEQNYMFSDKKPENETIFDQSKTAQSSLWKNMRKISEN